ncbi:MAG TPA: aromatic amino acid transaminase [Chlamydiales bacterium]|nr:aromatic amino acid transaminase [Chlamydiales bacterium]
MFFHEILEAQPDPIFGRNEAFQADVRPDKINLTIGIYKDEHLRAALIPSVKKMKEQILHQDLLADYLPLSGLPDFVEQIGMLVFGEKRWQANHHRVFAAQSLGGTGALQVGAQFLSESVGKTVAVPQLTWPNHRSIFERAGCLVETFPYYSRKTRGIDMEALCSSLREMREKTIVILHSVCHNPTGCDPSLDQWKELSQVMLKRKLLPFFDFAYQGFGDGIEKDRKAIEIFMDDGHEMLIAYSCSKNFSMYCQRVGALFIVDENAAVKLRVGSHIKKTIRSLYSNPPAHGARIVSALLQDADLKKEWEQDLSRMRDRISLVKESIIRKLSAKMDCEFLRHRKGMFLLIDLDKHQIQKLIDEFGIYLLDNGRISLTGLNEKNIDQVVNGLFSVCQK